jgi:hypothetical protein
LPWQKDWGARCSGFSTTPIGFGDPKPAQGRGQAEDSVFNKMGTSPK